MSIIRNLTKTRKKTDFLPRNYRSLKNFAKLAKEIDWDNLLKYCDYSPDEVQKLESTPNDFQTNKLVAMARLVFNDSYVYESLNNLTVFKPVSFINGIDDCKKEIRIIREDDFVRDMTYNSYYFRIKTNDVVMSCPETDTEFNFGQFQIDFFAEKVLIVGIVGNKADVNGYIHPYLASDKLCMGEFFNGYVSAMKQLRIADAFLFVKEIMTIYKGNEKNGTMAGPYSPFLNWAGIRCSICDEVHDAEETISCPIKRGNICPECAANSDYIDEYTGIIHMPEVLDVCKKCNKNTIRVRKGSCKVCRQSELSGKI